MTIEVGKQLTPSEVYYAAVGMFLSAGYQEIERITTNLEGVPELGRVFEKDGMIHVLYFPGKDNEREINSEKVTLPLSSIIATVDVSVNDLLKEKKLDSSNVSRHLIVCESNVRAKLYTREHFVYLNSLNNAATWNLHDSKSKGLSGYDLTPIKAILFPGWADGHGAASLHCNYHGIQNGHWECGYYALIFMMQSIDLSLSDAIFYAKDESSKKIIRDVMDRFARKIVEIRDGKLPAEIDGVTKDLLLQASIEEVGQPISDDLKAKMFAAIHDENKYQLPKKITPEIAEVFRSCYDSVPEEPALETEKNNDKNQSIIMSDKDFDEAFFDKKVSGASENNQTFFQRHRKTKYALIGLGIGLGLAVAGLVLAFAWPVVLPAVGGLIAAHIAVGAMATATVGWLGVGALGLVTTAIATGASLLIKRIKDKVSGAKPAPAGAAQGDALPKPVKGSFAEIKQGLVKPESQKGNDVSLQSASTVTATSSVTSSSTLTGSQSSGVSVEDDPNRLFAQTKKAYHQRKKSEHAESQSPDSVSSTFRNSRSSDSE